MQHDISSLPFSFFLNSSELCSQACQSQSQPARFSGESLSEIFPLPVLENILIEALSFGGEGIGRVVDDQGQAAGKKIFIPFAIPGEVVSAKITKEEKNFSRGRLQDITQPSTERVQAPCPVFGECGGCQLQHINLEEQRKLKLEMVEGFFRRQLGVFPEEGCRLLPSGDKAYGYRKRIRLKIDNERIGYYSPESHDLVEIGDCPIAEPELNAAFQAFLSNEIDEVSPLSTELLLEKSGDLVELFVYEGKKISSQLFYSPKEEKLTKLGLHQHKKVHIADSTSEHFSQVNRDANRALVDAVINEISEETLIDLYAGSGNFSLPAAAQGLEVNAVELDPELCRIGKERAEEEKLEIRFHAIPCEKFSIPDDFQGSIILDPPRRGAPDLIAPIIASKAKQVLYVSCSLPELCRDLKPLIQGGFTFQKALVIDMFPQTGHVEVLALLKRGQ